MIKIIKTKRHGLEVYLVLELHLNREHVFMSEAGARTYVKKLTKKGV